MSPADYKELENLLRTNNLPRMTMMMYGMLKVMGKREKENFEPHEIESFVNELAVHQDSHQELVLNIKTYLDHLNVTQIVTPVRRITEFIEDDLIASDPKFFGTIAATLQQVDYEHKKVTNTPQTGKLPWIKVMAIVAIIGLVIGIGWWIYDSGVFSGGIPGLNFNQGPTPQELLDQYPTPESLKSAVDRGEIKYDTLPKEIKDMVDNVKLPIAVSP